MTLSQLPQFAFGGKRSAIADAKTSAPRSRLATFLPLAAVAAICWPAQVSPAGEGAIAGYQDYAALTAAIRGLEKSPLAKVVSLASTRGGREVWLITLAAGKPEDKPAILLVGSSHAPQLVGSELALRVAQRLIALAEAPADAQPGSAESSARAEDLLARYTVYVIPRPNPDASEAFFQPPYCERAANETPTDDDRDGRLDEDPFEDLDGDGWITSLRIEDPAGDLIPSAADPRVLVKADRAKNETGRYRVISEGIDNDHDESFNEDPLGGVSFDRNFTFQYPFLKPGAGQHQVSEIESRAVADFAFSHSNIALVFSFGLEDNLVEPWKKSEETTFRKTAPPAADAERLAFLSQQYRALGGVAGATGSIPGEGSFARWAYFHFGRWSLVSRGWWVPPVDAKHPKPDKKPAADGQQPAEGKPAADGKPPADGKPAEGKAADGKPSDDKRGSDDINALNWFEREGIAGFVDWKPIEHPDFPGQKVEAGGFKPFARLNPPQSQLDPLAIRHCDFLLKTPDWLPRIHIDNVKVEPLGDGVFRLTIKVVNTGYLPTSPAIAEMSNHFHPVQIKLEPPDGTKLVSGVMRTRLDPLAGAGGGVEKTWLLRVPAGGNRELGIRVYSPSVGEDFKAVNLP